MLLLLFACKTLVLPGTEDTSQIADDTGDGLTVDTADTADVTGIDGPGDDETNDDDSSDVLFEDDNIPVFELTISDDSWISLINEPYEYAEATLTYEGNTYGPIGVRTKGENSWRPIYEKSSLKLDFNRYKGGPDRFLGMKGLTFNAMNEDYSMMHERVSYWLYRNAGLPAARANHAVIYINGDLYGLFTVMDSVDDVFLERWFEDPSGSMFEQHDGDLTDDYVQNDTYFQLEEGKGDRSALQGLADALENTGPNAIEEAGEHLNWENFWTYWAVGSVVMNFDAYPFRFAGDDCHLYHDPTTDQLYYIPHGVDETFYYATSNIEDSADGHISARCRDVTECRNNWASTVYDVLTLSENLEMAAYAEQVRDQISDWVEADPNRNYSMSYVEYYQDDMIYNINNRRNEINSQIGADPTP